MSRDTFTSGSFTSGDENDDRAERIRSLVTTAKTSIRQSESFDATSVQESFDDGEVQEQINRAAEITISSTFPMINEEQGSLSSSNLVVWVVRKFSVFLFFEATAA